MLYLKPIICFVIYDIVVYIFKEQIYRMMGICVLPRAKEAYMLERVIYTTQQIARKLPYIFINPSPRASLKEKLEWAVSRKEKVWIGFSSFICLFRFRLIYIIMILAVCWNQFTDDIKNNAHMLIRFLGDTDFIIVADGVIKYIGNNWQAILIIILSTLIIYIHILKRKRGEYVFELIWEEKTLESKRTVANAQYRIKKLLTSLRKKLIVNTKELCKAVEYIDIKSRFDTKFHFSNYRIMFEDYTNEIRKIKSQIYLIESVDGFDYYYKYNKKIWMQLHKLNLLDSDNTYYRISNLGMCDKKMIENTIEKSDELHDYKKLRKVMMQYWRDNLLLLITVERCLKYMKKRERRFEKTSAKLGHMKLLKETLEEIKEYSE